MPSIKDKINTYPVTHDDFFISSMSNLRVAKEFLQQHLPRDLLQAMVLDAIEICKDKFHTVDLKGQVTDMLYRIPLKNSNQPAYIAVLVEHQSKPRKNMPIRVLCYEAGIMQQHWEQYKVVPLVYTTVYYNGQSRWYYSRDIKDLIQAPADLINRYALQPFQLIELNQISDEELRHSLWAGVMSLAMKHIFDRDVIPALQGFIDLLKMLKGQHGGDELILSLLYYLYQRGEISDRSQFQALIAMELPKEIGEKTMTMAERDRLEATQSASRAIARNLLGEGLDPAFVKKTTGVEMDTIREIIAELKIQKV